jgi:hypothetical protein
MFYVKYRDDQVACFNSRCQTIVLMNYMRNVLKPAGAFDLIPQLADYKAVAPLGLAERGDTNYVNTFVNPRSTYFLAEYAEDEDAVREYKLTWKAKAGDEHDKVQAALDLRSGEEKKKAQGNKGKTGKK